MTDEELRSAFESCTLPFALWTHRAHVRMAFLYASQHPFQAALDRMRLSIQAYNASQQVPESLDRGYHETITVAFMRLVCSKLTRTGPFPDSEAFCERHPDLLDKSVLLKLYSKERLMSPEAKRGFVEPDLAELALEADLGA